MTDDLGRRIPPAPPRAPSTPAGAAAAGDAPPRRLDELLGEAAQAGRANPHLSLEAMARLRTGHEAAQLERELLPHLAAHCPACREQIAELGRLMAEAGHWDAEIAVIEWPDAPKIWARLAPFPYARQLRAVEADESCHTWGLCRYLERQSATAAPEDPRRAARLANLALRISRHLGPAYGRDWICDLRALVFARLADARRRLGEMESAGDAFDDAESERTGGTGDPAIAAELRQVAERLPRGDRVPAETVNGGGDAG